MPRDGDNGEYVVYGKEKRRCGSWIHISTPRRRNFQCGKEENHEGKHSRRGKNNDPRNGKEIYWEIEWPREESESYGGRGGCGETCYPTTASESLYIFVCRRVPFHEGKCVEDGVDEMNSVPWRFSWSETPHAG